MTQEKRNVEIEIVSLINRKGGSQYDKFRNRISSNRFYMVRIEILHEAIQKERKLWLWMRKFQLKF